MTDHSPERDPSPATSSGHDRTALGAALQARADRIATVVASQYPEPLRATVDAWARGATDAVGRWVATGDSWTGAERQAVTRPFLEALLAGSDLAAAVGTHLMWRDLCDSALDEVAEELSIASDPVLVARSFVQLTCDGGIVRLARAFDVDRRESVRRFDGEQAELAHRVLHDGLTGLPNRTLLDDRLHRAARAADRRGRRPMVLLLDIDSFTAINDRFGHPAGDALLLEVAHRLGGLVRASDTLARMDDDQFVILVEDFDDPEPAARSLAERIHQAMCAPVAVDDRELHSSVSIGITDVVADVGTDELLARAEAAMERARRSGPARYAVYEEADRPGHRHGRELADDLRVAHSRGELTLDYQPLFHLDAGSPARVAGMEALLRWDHPVLGAVEPEVFVPLLEQSRQIVPVGRWVLEEAATQCVEWQARFPGLEMAVNVSARQLADDGFLDDVGDALRRSGLDPARLVLEVAESVLMVDVVRVGTTMQAVHDLGVTIAIDDFGTGHSSLLYLQGLPIDRLKIDRTFIEALGADRHDRTVIRTVVELAHRLGIAVVAEGVETEAELHEVRAIGCDEAQGYLLGPPLPVHRQSFDGDPLVVANS